MSQRRAAGGIRGGGRAWLAAALAATLLAGAAKAQAPPAPPPAGDGQAEAEPPKQVGDLTTRYRFIERYAAPAEKPKPGEVGQYRAAVLEVIRFVDDKPQGAPARTEVDHQIVYTERPAVVNSSGLVTDTVRRYEAFRVTPPVPAPPSSPKPLEGLEVWFRPRKGTMPLVMTVGADHPLSETEYGVSTGIIFFPDLVSLLPALPSRIGDRWQVPASGITALLGDRPMQGSQIRGTLVDVRKAADGPNLVAQLQITGRIEMPPSRVEKRLNARLQFTFAPPAAEEAATGTVDARGAITELRLAESSTFPLAGAAPETRLKRAATRERTLQRQLAAADTPLLDVPFPAPIPTQANSWLTFDDPKGRFHFRHPQDLIVDRDPVVGGDDDVIQLRDPKLNPQEGRVLVIGFQPKTGDPAADKASRDPNVHIKELSTRFAEEKQDVLWGPAAWLPDADWGPNKMKVFRIEAALRPADSRGKNVARVFLDQYLVLFTQNESLVVQGTTGQDPPLPFRKQVEEVLKTFKLEPSKKTRASTGTGG